MVVRVNGSTGIITVSGTSGAPSLRGPDGNSGISFDGDQVIISSSGLVAATFSDSAATINNLSVDTTTLEFSPGSSGTPTVAPSGDLNTGIYFPAADTIGFAEGGNEAARIDSSGRLLIGTSSARTNAPGGTEGLLLEGTSSTNSQNRFAQFFYGEAGAAGPYIGLAKHRSTSIGGNTIVNNGDELGGIYFQGADGSDFRQGAYIAAVVDATPGASDMPGRLVFATSGDGSANPTARTIIDLSGTLRPAADNTYQTGSLGTRWTAVWAVNGTIQTSDERLKTEITDSVLASDFIKSLRPVSYKWIEGGKTDSGERDENGETIYESVPGQRTHWGFISQEVKQAADDAGVDFGGWVLGDKDDPESTQSLRYDQFIAPLTKALQEALAKIETLETVNASLEARLTALESA